MIATYSNIPIAGGDTAKPLNITKRLKLIGKHIEPGRSKVVDCGCGEGGYVKALIDHYGVDCVGVEYVAEKVAQAHCNPLLVSRVVQGDIEQMPYGDATFDLGILNEVLEHVPNESKVLQEIHRVLAPRGKIMLFSPNRWFPFETHGVYWKGTDTRLPHYVPLVPFIPLRLGNLVFRYWARNYWQGQLASIVRAANFKMIEHTWIWQTFENISGMQPRLIQISKPILRSIANACEQTPIIRRFGVSQVIVAEKV
jgi:ubiquinone/menaquinone biosynthesis C-methylase UbiE